MVRRRSVICASCQKNARRRASAKTRTHESACPSIVRSTHPGSLLCVTRSSVLPRRMKSWHCCDVEPRKHVCLPGQSRCRKYVSSCMTVENCTRASMRDAVLLLDPHRPPNADTPSSFKPPLVFFSRFRQPTVSINQRVFKGQRLHGSLELLVERDATVEIKKGFLNIIKSN